MELLLQYLPSTMLIFCRITAFFVVTPIFSARNVPVQFKVAFSFFVTLVAVLSVQTQPVIMDGLYVLMIFKETLVGLLMGFLAYLFFTIVQISGSFIDMQMGFSIANIIDPMTGAQSPILGNLKFMLATMLFLSFDGHHYMISAILQSYQWIPIDNEVFSRMQEGAVTEFLVKSIGLAFSLSFQMAAPLIASLFLIDVGLGILAKTAPQMNVFVLGMPIKVIAGFVLLMLVFPGFLYLFSDLFKDMFDNLQKLVELLANPTSP